MKMEKKLKTTVTGRNLESPKCKRQNVQEETDKETKNGEQSRKEQEGW